MLRESNFGNYAFTATDLMSIVGVSNPTFSTLQKQKIIEAKMQKVGAVNRKVYDWEDLQKLTTRYKERLPKPPKAKIKTFTNLKGGVGKTTVSTHFAMRAATLGLKTLFIDMDPQGNATQSFGFLDNDEELTIYDCLTGKHNFEDALFELTPLLHLIPGHIGLNQGEFYLRSKNNGQQKLKMYLDKVSSNYDLIVIDTNAALTFLSLNAILAADELCITVETAMYSVSGMGEISKVFDGLHEDYPDFNPTIRIIPNKFDSNKANCDTNLQILRAGYGDFTTEVAIRNSADFEHALNASQSITFFKKKSNASQDIVAITDELLKPGYNARFYES